MDRLLMDRPAGRGCTAGRDLVGVADLLGLSVRP